MGKGLHRKTRRSNATEATCEPFEQRSQEHNRSLIKIEKAKAFELRKSAWWQALAREGGCHYCGRSVPPEEITMDHVIPLSQGGRSTKGNLVPCCKDCNNRKKDEILITPSEMAAFLENVEHDSKV